MPLTKNVYVDQIETLKNGSVQVRTKIDIIDNDEIVASSFHRHIISPGEDYSLEDIRVKAVCETLHTTEVIASYQSLIKNG